jgi:hypothetical protein
MKLADFWAALRALFYGLWVCRVSFLSVIAGFALFLLVPEAQAVFLDLHARVIGLWHWFAFYGSVFLFWMLPVQLSARVMLQEGRDRVVEEDARWYAYLLVHLPWVLALACLAAVAVGQYGAMDHLPDLPNPPFDPRSTLDPLEVAASSQLTTLLCTTLVLIALWLVAWVVLPRAIHRHAVRQGLLDIGALRFIATIMFGHRATTRGYGTHTVLADGDRAGELSPGRLQSAGAAVGLAVILLVGLLLIFRSPLDIWSSISRAPMFPVLVGAWLPLLTVFVYAAHWSRLPVLAAFILLMTFTGNWMTGLHDVRLTVQTGETGPLEARQVELKEALAWWRKANGCGETPVDPCNKRPIIVAAEGGASRAGFFTGSLLAHIEDLSVKADPKTPFSRQLFAVSTVSGSSLGLATFAALLNDSQGEAWPRPVTEDKDNALWFKSGRAFGVGGTKVEPLPSPPTRKDILQQIVAGDFLTSTIAALSLDLWAPWHARFGGRDHGDRTYFLERTWERRFLNSVEEGSGKAKPRFDRALSTLAPDANRWRPLLIFNGASITTGKRIITSTLYPRIESPDDKLRLESVFRDSYDAYDLMCVSDTAGGKGGCSCERETEGQLRPLRVKGCDIPLSTAVSNSARFPIISSHGDIKTGDAAGGPRVVDRIVDGGYFDYSGLVSALELRLQISRFDDALKPLVLFVTNDPGFNPEACQKRVPDELDALSRPAHAPSKPIDPTPFSILAYPIDALLKGRISRAEQTMANAVLLNRYDNIRKKFYTAPDKLSKLRTEGLQSFLNFDVVSVGARCKREDLSDAQKDGNKKGSDKEKDSNGEIRPVPMSWWLAMPTQAFLDSELCQPHNQNTIAGVLSQLGEQPEENAQNADADASRREEIRNAQKDRFDAMARLVTQTCPDVGARRRSRQVR